MPHSKGFRSPQGHPRRKNKTNTKQKKTTEQIKVCFVCLDPDTFVTLSMKLTVTLTSDLCCVFVDAWCDDFHVCMYVCMHAAAAHTFECLCEYGCVFSFITQNPVWLFLCLCCTTQPNSSLWGGLRFFFCSKLLPLAELILFGKLPSCFALFIGQQLREQTRTKCHSQLEGEQIGRAQSEGET